ncbi:uncharacterized protein LOC121367436 isoform X2 [Gigantopelta aegis]|uniref:uncharacterized protein LOC121367436 isoform X2 n=1 Tax=Gigantopelta aegis TaxID=1735272 RepID=UPI001B88C9A0|nr:uncharacterized protein LOC121367436 isoform X2 [Gigantopelta aegis]
MEDIQWLRSGIDGLFYTSFIWMLLASAVNSETVYLDKYGHCIADDFVIDGDVYLVLPKGGGLQHETLHCDVTFKARADNGICLTFNNMYIKDCGVKLKIFAKSSASGFAWRTFGCDETFPKQICSGSRYVTIKLQKEKLNSNKNYDFEIRVEESESFTGESVFFVSVGIFVAIIVGVIVLIIILAVLIICCCCKNRQRTTGHVYQATSSAPSHVEPSAPPPPLYEEQGQTTPGLYPPLPHNIHPACDEPPPYTPHPESSYGSQAYPAPLETKTQYA